MQDDNSLVKMRTLKAMLQQVFKSIPRPGPGLGQRVSKDGAVWAVDFSNQTHPFKVTHISGDDFTVQAGQIDGETIASTTLDVGSSRPVAIRVVPNYNVLIYNSEFAYAHAILGGLDAPTLEASSSTDDVSVLTSVGDEARVVIATIDADNAVSQIATGNIVSTGDDDGTLTGQRQLSFNKAS